MPGVLSAQEVTLRVSLRLALNDDRLNLLLGVIINAADPATRPQAIDFFKREYVLIWSP